MPLSRKELLLLQRLVQERPLHCAADDLAVQLHQRHGLGTLYAGQVVYSPADHEMASRLLCAQSDTESGSIQSTCNSGGCFEEQPDAVAVRCVGWCSLDGQVLNTPSSSYFVVSTELFERIACSRLLLVQNFDVFRQLSAYSWIDYLMQDVLVVYRGGESYSPVTALSCVHARSEPVWAFVDYDPQGLLAARSVCPGRLEKLILPTFSWLREASASSTARRRYEQQAHLMPAVRQAEGSSLVKALSYQLAELGGAVTQQRMRWAYAQMDMSEVPH